MNILKSTPRQDGFWMPAEYGVHEGCLMIFPERADSWKYGGYTARKAFCEVAMAIARSEKVTVAASAKQYDNARALFPPQIRVVEMSSNDSWARDYGPTFVVNKEGVVRGIDWGFNSWGGLVDGLYFPWDQDNKLARKFCDILDKDVYDKRDFILEGGSIHVDGEGTALVTESCLLSKGRNSLLSKVEIEETLKAYLSVEKVLWLPRGIYKDETNEHVDNICAFVKPGEVVLAWTEDREDPQYTLSKVCLDYLSSQTDARGRGLTIHRLPLPHPLYMEKYECEGLDACDGEATRKPGDRLAASYVNFYIANQAIIMPGFHDPQDEKAKKILEDLFPNREVIQVYTRDILLGGGNIHCITQQIPKSGCSVSQPFL